MLLKFSKWDINTNIPFQAADSVSKLRFLVTFFFPFSGVVYACILNIVKGYQHKHTFSRGRLSFETALPCDLLLPFLRRSLRMYSEHCKCKSK